MDPDVLAPAADGSTLHGADTTTPVGVPTLILAADDNIGAAFTSSHERRLATTHPNVKVVRVAGAGHVIHGGRASRDTYADHLARFLDQHH